MAFGTGMKRDKTGALYFQPHAHTRKKFRPSLLAELHPGTLCVWVRFRVAINCWPVLLMFHSLNRVDPTQNPNLQPGTMSAFANVVTTRWLQQFFTVIFISVRVLLYNNIYRGETHLSQRKHKAFYWAILHPFHFLKLAVLWLPAKQGCANACI